MKRNDFLEIKNLNIESLVEKIKVLKKEVDGLVFDKNIGKLKNLKSISKKRKDVAQMLTVLRQKQLLIELESNKDIKVSKEKGEVKRVSPTP